MLCDRLPNTAAINNKPIVFTDLIAVACIAMAVACQHFTITPIVFIGILSIYADRATVIPIMTPCRATLPRLLPDKRTARKLDVAVGVMHDEKP